MERFIKAVLEAAARQHGAEIRVTVREKPTIQSRSNSK